VNIVAGAGYHVEPSHPTWLRCKSSDEIAQRIMQDIQVGIDNAQIRAGSIGEIGCAWPMSKGEYAVLEASAAAQRVRR
jgi:phosphotriesterase-related protein